MEQRVEVDEQEAEGYNTDNELETEGIAGESPGSGPQSDRSQWVPAPRSADVDSQADKSRASTESLTGSFLEQQHVEHGRTYCSNDYYMPNDEAEQTRLAITHQAFLQILDGQLSMARIPANVTRVLDIGTGTGDWATAIAERFPNAEIIATDIAPFQPTEVPPNVFFELDDAREEWTYSRPFDFIHIRGLAGAFSDWSAIYSEARKHLRQGGTLEVSDFGIINDPNTSPDSYLSIFNGACRSAAEKAGTRISLEHLKKATIEESGLSVARSRVLDVPLGTWSTDPQKQVSGKMALISALEGLEAMSLRLLTKHLNWKEEEVRDICEKVKEELLRPGVRATIPCQFMVARRMLA